MRVAFYCTVVGPEMSRQRSKETVWAAQSCLTEMNQADSMRLCAGNPFGLDHTLTGQPYTCWFAHRLARMLFGQWFQDRVTACLCLHPRQLSQ